MFVKILFVLIMAFLNWARGYHWRPYCIASMSIFTGLYMAIYFNTWWLLFACGIPMGICLGLNDQNRGVWCSLVASGASFALVMTGHLLWWLWVIYCTINYLLGAVLNKNKVQQSIIDPITGAGVGGIVWLI